MGRRRYLHSDLSTSPELASLAVGGDFLPVSIYLLSHMQADDWGRLPGDAMRLKMLVAPGMDCSLAQFNEALEKVSRAGLWEMYEVDERQYISFLPEEWFRVQSYVPFVKQMDDSKSQFPSPHIYKAWLEKISANQRKSAQSETSGVGTSETEAVSTPKTAKAPGSPAKNSKKPRKSAQIRSSPSPSPSPSPSSEDSVFCEEPKPLTPQQQKFQKVFAVFDEPGLPRPPAPRVAGWLKALDAEDLIQLLTQLGPKKLANGVDYITKAVHNHAKGLRPGATARVGGDDARTKALEALS